MLAKPLVNIPTKIIDNIYQSETKLHKRQVMMLVVMGMRASRVWVMCKSGKGRSKPIISE